MSNLIPRPQLKEKYDNYINGKWTAPSTGQYFEVLSPVDGKLMAKAAHSAKMDVEMAVNAADEAFKTFSQTSATERSIMLNKIADRIEANLEYIAAVETLDNGKAIRETMAADIPLAIDHFRYFASVIRAEEGSITELDKDTVSIIVHEPIGVVAQIIPWNFPILMAVWKLAPALAAGNCVVLKPAESTPISIMVLMEIIGDLVPAGVINVINGFGAELGRTLVTNPKVCKAAFTGSTATGRMVMQYATENIIPVTLELGGKSPNIFFPSVMDADDAFLDKALEGVALFALNQGEVCTCPSRLLIHESIYDKFIETHIKGFKMKNVHDVVANAINNLTKVTFKKNAGIVVLNYKNEFVDCNAVTLFDFGVVSHIKWEGEEFYTEDYKISDEEYKTFYQAAVNNLLGGQSKQENRPSISSTQKPPRDTDPLPLRVVTESYDPNVNLEKLRRK